MYAPGLHNTLFSMSCITQRASIMVYICPRGLVEYCASENVTPVWHSVAPHILQYLDRVVLENVFFMNFTGAYTHNGGILHDHGGA